ncbi:MAG: DNA mismatch repair protein MutL [Bellilinea sp.]|nr:MAG: DNA mismatch repair protein MutL [Bellilinea sp.]
MPIRILAEAVASQIAAGEVVERPASVVKELMENSLDAGAERIEIRIANAGKTLIEVADDGCGIPAGEMNLAVARHATSKLSSAEDLFRIATLGFRGEALASIGSVSRLTLISREKNAEEGRKIIVEGGKLIANEAVGTTVGTVARVENLFFNVPARLKFLRSDLTEKNQIIQFVSRYALAYPQVRFRLMQDDRDVFITHGKNNRREVLAQLYGNDLARQLLEVELEDGDIRITGFISPVGISRSNRREIIFFVNGRWVQDVGLSTALIQAYHTLLMVGRYPIAFLFVELSPDMVDVNVHPAKAEVRFRDADHVFRAVQRAVKRALLAYSPAPQLGSNTWQNRSGESVLDPGWEIAHETEPRVAGIETASPEKAGEPQSIQLPVDSLPLLRVIGQVGAAYLVAEGPDGLYLIDQHAAHERVLFEKFMREADKEIPSQALLQPQTFELPPQAAELLQTHLSLLNRWGFEVQHFGGNAFRVRRIPAMLSGLDPVVLVRSLVEDFEEDETPLQTEIEARVIARVCKRAAVKAGQILSAEEQNALVRDLERCQSPRTCPHGRPTMIHLSVDLLERQFGRRGSR